MPIQPSGVRIYFADHDLSGHGVSRLGTRKAADAVYFPDRVHCSSLANYFSPIAI